MANSAYEVLKDEPLIMKDMSDKHAYFHVDEDGVPGLWLIAPRTAGASDEWASTARDCAERAKHSWFRIFTDMASRSYRPVPSKRDLGKPEFPVGETFMSLINIAFKGKIIKGPDCIDHPVIKKKIGA